MRASVCIASTRPDTVGAAVRSIVRQTYRDWEVIVVAQGPASREIAATVRRELGDRDGRTIVQAGAGISRARNAAVGAATGEIIAMTDDDCEAAEDWLSTLVARFRPDRGIGIVGGSVLPPLKARRGPANCPRCFPEERVHRPTDRAWGAPASFGVIGANLAFTRHTARAVGQFDEHLGAGTDFPVAEEIDFLRRAGALGISVASTPRAVVHHTGGWRYGARAVWKMQRDYARGNGGYAAKKTLLGDPTGAADLREMLRLTAVDWWQRRAPVALPAGLSRYYCFASGYRDCMRDFEVGVDGLLRRKRALDAARRR